ncbi:MAG TPA: hypothetical protein VGO11_19845 [Chthoniobacteraceae bacterium]|jgi:hypothetical protein|nr:hypothetical protein [Chthoniobacteraceae bacterium]
MSDVGKCIPAAIAAAYKKSRKATEALMAEVKRAYPLGCLVQVKLGRAKIEAEVIGHSDAWWYSPSEVRVRNRRTGTVRKFAATSERHEARVIHAPMAEIRAAIQQRRAAA